MRAQGVEHLPAGFLVPQAEVGHHHVGLRHLGQAGQRIGPRLRAQAVAAPARQQRLHAQAHRLVVVHHQHAAACQAGAIVRAGHGLIDQRAAPGREPEPEDRTAPEARAHLHLRVHGLRQALHDGQAQPQALAAVALGVAELVEFLEDLLLVRGRDAAAGVPHLQRQPAAAHAAGDQQAARARVAQRVGDEVAHHQIDQRLVGQRCRRGLARAVDQRGSVGLGAEFLLQRAQQRLHGERRVVRLHHPRLQA